MSMIYFKDGFRDEKDCHVSIRDRSFRFGDGIFETMMVIDGRICDMEPHIRRLQSGLQAFRLDSLDVSKLPEICKDIVTRNKVVQGYVRIIISRGVDAEGVVGYLPKGSEPYFIIQSVEKPYPEFKPVRLWQSSYNAGMHTPAKTNNALIYTLAMMEAADNACDNALLLDREGNICETATGNIFWITGGTLYTPAVSLPFVPGTIRNKLLKLWEGECAQGHYTVEAIGKADEIFMTNIGSLLAPVVAIEPLGKKVSVGEKTKYLRKRLDEEMQRK